MLYPDNRYKVNLRGDAIAPRFPKWGSKQQSNQNRKTHDLSIKAASADVLFGQNARLATGKYSFRKALGRMALGLTLLLPALGLSSTSAYAANTSASATYQKNHSTPAIPAPTPHTKNSATPPPMEQPNLDKLLGKRNRLSFENYVYQENQYHRSDLPVDPQDAEYIATILLDALKDRSDILNALINLEGGLAFHIYHGPEICQADVRCFDSNLDISQSQNRMIVLMTKKSLAQSGALQERPLSSPVHHELGRMLGNLTLGLRGQNVTANIFHLSGQLPGWNKEQIEWFKLARNYEQRKISGNVEEPTVFSMKALVSDDEFLADLTEAYFVQPEKLHETAPVLFHLMDVFFHPGESPNGFPCDPADSKKTKNHCEPLPNQGRPVENPFAATKSNFYHSPSVTFYRFLPDKNHYYQEADRAPFSPYEDEISTKISEMLKDRPDLFYALTHLPGGLHITVYDGNWICTSNESCLEGDAWPNPLTGSISIREASKAIQMSAPKPLEIFDTGDSVTHHEVTHILDFLTPSNRRGPIESYRVWLADGYLPGWTEGQKKLFREQRALEQQKLRGEIPGPTALMRYALTNDNEFLATLVEVYFKVPNRLRERSPILYQLIDEFFHPQKYPHGFPDGEHVRTGL